MDSQRYASIRHVQGDVRALANDGKRSTTIDQPAKLGGQRADTPISRQRAAERFGERTYLGIGEWRP